MEELDFSSVIFSFVGVTTPGLIQIVSFGNFSRLSYQDPTIKNLKENLKRSPNRFQDFRCLITNISNLGPTIYNNPHLICPLIHNPAKLLNATFAFTVYINIFHDVIMFIIVVNICIFIDSIHLHIYHSNEDE